MDRLVLPVPVQHEGGRVRLQIREFERERTWLDEVGLSVVDHPDNLSVGADETGRLFLYEGYKVPLAAVDATGRDRLSEVVARDGVAFDGHAGDVLYLEYEADDARGSVPIELVTSNKPPADGPGQGTGTGPTTSGGIIASMRGEKFLNSESHTRIVPRENLGARWTSLEAGPGDPAPNRGRVQVKLEWNSSHPLDFAGLPRVSPTRPIETGTSLMAAVELRHDGTSSLELEQLLAQDNRSVVISPGDRLDVGFDVPSSAKGGSRTLVLTAVGHYVRLPEAEQDSPADNGLVEHPLTLTVQPGGASSAAATLSFELTHRESVVLNIYSVSGRLVRQLVRDVLPAGSHTLTWNGEDESGMLVGAGIYYCRLGAANRTTTAKVAITH